MGLELSKFLDMCLTDCCLSPPEHQYNVWKTTLNEQNIAGTTEMQPPTEKCFVIDIPAETVQEPDKFVDNWEEFLANDAEFIDVDDEPDSVLV
jgi:hypothetical protein